jgi:hypothetical protein
MPQIGILGSFAFHQKRNTLARTKNQKPTMKKIALSLFVVAALCTTAAAQNQNSSNGQSQSSSTVEEKTGVIIELDADGDGGKIADGQTGALETFRKQGASVQFVLGDNVRYVKVTTPTGKVIIRDIRHSN